MIIAQGYLLESFNALYSHSPADGGNAVSDADGGREEKPEWEIHKHDDAVEHGITFGEWGVSLAGHHHHDHSHHHSPD